MSFEMNIIIVFYAIFGGDTNKRDRIFPIKLRIVLHFKIEILDTENSPQRMQSNLLSQIS